MTGTELLVAFVFGLITIYIITQKSKRKNYPPGPWGFPIVGHLPLLGTEPYKTLQSWTTSKRFGPVISVQFGSYPSIVINDMKLLKEALNDIAFSGRPNINFFLDRSGGIARGITFTEGERWEKQRRFTLRHLRDFGFGKKSMEAIIHEEVTELIETFRKAGGEPMSIRNAFNAAILNAIWSILTGERFKHDDPELMRCISLLTSNIQENNTIQGLATFLPWFARMFPNFSGYNNILKDVPEIISFLNKPVQHHEETFQDGVHRDFLDVYIQETRNTTDPKSPFHSSNSDILWVVIDLFVAGAETTSTALAWTFMYLSKFSKVQEKLQQEIEKVVGTSRLPALSDRSEMHYTQAVINEILRFSSMVPFGLFHNTTKEVQLGGYTIPKDTLIIPNLYAVHFDEEIWKDPQNFRPERFIDQNGKFEKNDALVAFSYGKRVCLGESLARDEFFLFLTSIFQKFIVSSEKEIDLSPNVGAILSPKNHNFILKERL